MKTKKKVMGLLAIACVGAAALGAASLNGAVEASAATPEAFSSFAMENGAAIYVGDVESANAKEGNGIRWHITMDAQQYAALATSGYTDIKFGILVAPEEGYELTEENVFGDNAIYDWAEKQPDGNYEYSGTDGAQTGDKKRIANFYTDELFVPEDVSNASYVEFYGAITNLKDGADGDEVDTTNNLTRMFEGKGYIEYKDGTETKYVWVGDEDNVRSMAYVAQLAIADDAADAPTTEIKTWLGDNYIAKAPNVNWYIEHYLQKDDGTYETTAYSTTTHTGAPSATANAYKSPITLDGYHMNELKTEGWQGFVWANNSTTLKLYYEKNDLSVSYGDYQVGFVQNDYNADAMENKIVDGKLVTVVGDSILDSQNAGIGNVNTARPQLVISGLNAGELYTVNVTVSTAEESFLFVPYTAQGLGSSNHYGIFNEGEEKTFTASNLVADENGQIAFGSWYGSVGTYTWENVVVISDEPVATYDGYQVRYIKDNSLPAETTIITTVNQDGKLVTTTNGEQGSSMQRAKLVVYGLRPNVNYCIKLKPTVTMWTAFYKTEDTTKNVYAVCDPAAGTQNGSFSHVAQTNEKGEWVYEGVYAGAGSITWDLDFVESTTFDNGITLGMIHTNNNTAQTLPVVNADKSLTINGPVESLTTYFIKGLQANTTYTVKLYITLAIANGATNMQFSANQANTNAMALNPIQWLRSDTNANIDKQFTAEELSLVSYITATITTDENGCFMGTGWYISGIVTITGIEATAN